MAAQLYQTHSVFRNAMDRCHALAQPYLEHGLLDVIFAEGSDDALVNRTDYTQPALFAVEYALAQLFLARGVQPQALLGYSLGEYVCACLAGVLSLADALRLVARRALRLSSASAASWRAALARIGSISALPWNPPGARCAPRGGVFVSTVTLRHRIVIG